MAKRSAEEMDGDTTLEHAAKRRRIEEGDEAASAEPIEHNGGAQDEGAQIGGAQRGEGADGATREPVASTSTPTRSASKNPLARNAGPKPLSGAAYDFDDDFEAVGEVTAKRKQERSTGPASAAPPASSSGGGMRFAPHITHGYASSLQNTSQFGSIQPGELEVMRRETFEAFRMRVYQDAVGMIRNVQRKWPRSKESFTEIEIRLGKALGGKSFRPGVSKEFFDVLLKSYQEDHRLYKCTNIEQTDYVFDEPSRFRISEVKQEGGGVKLVGVKKEKLDHHNIRAMPRLQYDIRIGASREVERKKRYSFRGHEMGDSDMWQIDLTVCHKLERSGADDGMEPLTHEEEEEREEVTYEVEFELPLWVWGKIDSEEFISRLCQRLWEHVETRVNNFHLCLDPVTNGDIAREVQQRIWHLILHDATAVRNWSQFPGAMPVAFSRRFFSTIQQEEYHCSEKSDGVRYMMLVRVDDTSRRIFLIDRKCTVYSLSHHFEFLAAAFHWYSQYYGRKGDTLLDGEIVQHRKTMRRMFLLFDIVALNDVYVGQLHLNERLKRISHVVMEFRKQMSRMSQSAMRVLPFELIGKTFFPCNEAGIEALQKCIEKDDGERFFHDAAYRRYHMTDGVIFTPSAEPYKPKGCENLFKWKFPDMLSVDFQVIEKDGEFMFGIGGPYNSLIPCRNAKLMQEDEMKLLDMIEARRRLFERFTGTQNYNLNQDLVPLIVEANYDGENGAWRIMKQRPDKAKPNYITVCFDTMEASMENITEEELFYRVSARRNDDWSAKMSAFLKSMKRASGPRPPG